MAPHRYADTGDIARAQAPSSFSLLPQKLWCLCPYDIRRSTELKHHPSGGCPADGSRQIQPHDPQGSGTPPAGLTQPAHGSLSTKGTYVSALYRRLAARRGKRRAVLAVARSIMVSIFHMPSRSEPSCELGGHYFDERRRQYTVDRLILRIEH
jgi:hypothetical protein